MAFSIWVWEVSPDSTGWVTVSLRLKMIWSSHIIREGDILADRGYKVTLVSKPSWRATKTMEAGGPWTRW